MRWESGQKFSVIALTNRVPLLLAADDRTGFVGGIRLEGSRLFEQPYRNKRRLTKKQSEEIQDWEQARKDMFQCGHRNSLAIELSPADIIELGYLLGRIFGGRDNPFKVFRKVGDWCLYDDEVLLIQPASCSPPL